MSVEKLDLTSPDLVNQNIEKLAALFPNCVTEGADGKAIDFDLLKQELNNEVIELLITKRKKWENSLRLLEAVSPLNTIKRGYAIILNKDKKIIKCTSDIKINDRIFTMLGDGGVFSKIEEIQPNKK